MRLRRSLLGLVLALGLSQGAFAQNLKESQLPTVSPNSADTVTGLQNGNNVNYTISGIRAANTPLVGNALTINGGGVTFTGLAGSGTQCLQVNTNGLVQVSGIGPCGSGGGGGGGVTSFNSRTGAVTLQAGDVGAVISDVGLANSFFSALSVGGGFTKTRPACGTLSDSASSCNTDATNANNISSGLLNPARLPLASSSAFGAVKVDGSTITASGGVISAPGGGGGITQLTGDVNAGPGSGSQAATIQPNVVTNAKLAQANALTIKANPTNSVANDIDATIGAGLSACVSNTAICTSTPDRTSTSSTTVASTDMGGQVNLNGTSLTLTIPAISSSVFGAGQTLIYDNINSSNLSISSTPTINGLPSATLLHQFGWVAITSNGTTLDAIGFPGFGTITTNALAKYVDSSGATTASTIVDTGAGVTIGSPTGGALGAGTFNATGLAVNGDQNLAFLDVSQSFTKGQAVTPTAQGTQSAGGTMTMDFSTSNNFTATFGAGNLTIANPTNIKSGECGSLALTQDGTGGRTVTWGTDWKWAGGTAPTLSTTASASDLLTWCTVSTSVIVAQLSVKGYQ